MCDFSHLFVKHKSCMCAKTRSCSESLRIRTCEPWLIQGWHDLFTRDIITNNQVYWHFCIDICVDLGDTCVSFRVWCMETYGDVWRRIEMSQHRHTWNLHTALHQRAMYGDVWRCIGVWRCMKMYGDVWRHSWHLHMRHLHMSLH